VNPVLRRGYGGSVRLVISLLMEQIFSMLLAPAMMLFHTTFVLTTLAGKPVVWNAQERGDRGIRITEALVRHAWHMALGLVWGASILLLAPTYIWWMVPVLAGLLLSVPLTVLSSRADVGRFVRRPAGRARCRRGCVRGAGAGRTVERCLGSCARQCPRARTSVHGADRAALRELPQYRPADRAGCDRRAHRQPGCILGRPCAESERASSLTRCPPMIARRFPRRPATSASAS